MYIDEYLTKHPEKIPFGEDLQTFSSRCEEYLEDARDLVPYNSEHYTEEVFDICISCATSCKELEDSYEYMYSGGEE